MLNRRELMAGVAATAAAAAAGRIVEAEEISSADLSGGWTTISPRPEIAPEFAINPTGGPGGRWCCEIRSDARDGLDGAWVRSFPVEGGKFYRFSALYRAERVVVPRRSVVVKL